MVFFSLLTSLLPPLLPSFWEQLVLGSCLRLPLRWPSFHFQDQSLEFIILITNLITNSWVSPHPRWAGISWVSSGVIFFKLPEDFACSYGRVQASEHCTSRFKVKMEKSSCYLHQLKSIIKTRCPQGQRVHVVWSRHGPSVCSLFSLYMFIKLQIRHAVLDLNWPQTQLILSWGTKPSLYSYLATLPRPAFMVNYLKNPCFFNLTHLAHLDKATW